LIANLAKARQEAAAPLPGEHIWLGRSWRLRIPVPTGWTTVPAIHY